MRWPFDGGGSRQSQQPDRPECSDVGDHKFRRRSASEPWPVRPQHCGCRSRSCATAQSTYAQVQTNLESQRRQYDLVGEARRLGFRDIEGAMSSRGEVAQRAFPVLLQLSGSVPPSEGRGEWIPSARKTRNACRALPSSRKRVKSWQVYSDALVADAA